MFATRTPTFREQLTRRRALLIAPAAFAGLVALSSRRAPRDAGDAAPGEVDVVEFSDAGERIGLAKRTRVVRSDGEWKRMLTADQFYVTRRQSTDTPFTGTYYKLHEEGLFRCVCCGTALFGSEAKYDSGTGWPSFWEPLAEENIRTRRDTSLLMERTEVSCTLCGAHLGHVFPDGPPPTGMRYCLNESSLRFVPRRS